MRKAILVGALVGLLLGLAWPWITSADARKITWKRALASYYSPADSGGAFACTGIKYTDYDTLGVAHKTLPCGTKVRFLYKHRKITVRVIDRGPFIAGREFDLLVATKNRLKCPDLCTLNWRVVR